MDRAIGTFKNKEKYAQLRKNALRSTIDSSEVCRAWDKEFHRLRSKIFIDCELVMKERKNRTDEWNSDLYNDSHIDEYIYSTYKETKQEEEEEEQKQEISTKRMSDRLIAGDEFPLVFKISLGSQTAEKVYLVGSFGNWKKQYLMTYDQYTNHWFITLHLKKNKYWYFV
jgi:hypothetical protein